MNEKLNSDLVAKRYQTREVARMEIYGRQEILLCRMNNLSSSGAFFEITHAKNTPKMGDLVQVTVTLKQLGKTHVLNGEVVWCKGLGVGVSFIKQKDFFKRFASTKAG